MIAYGFVPVGGPGPAKMSGLRPGSLFRRANTAFPCLAGVGRASEVCWFGGDLYPEPSLGMSDKDFMPPGGFLLPDKICR